MYQDDFNELMQIISDNKKEVIIINSKVEQSVPKYFVYNDNQSNGETIKRLCQI